MFGKRLLRSWVGRPLVDKTWGYSSQRHGLIELTERNSVLQQRIDAVEEARLGESTNLALLRGLLKGLPDLGRGFFRIQYGRVGSAATPFITDAHFSLT